MEAIVLVLAFAFFFADEIILWIKPHWRKRKERKEADHTRSQHKAARSGLLQDLTSSDIITVDESYLDGLTEDELWSLRQKARA